jgi:hypothetical protein
MPDAAPAGSPTLTDLSMRLLTRAAQTNLDLYAQLHALGWERHHLVMARDAYMLALRLFSDRFRANGKPFVAHLVGTASILAMLGARPAVVLGGMLHAAYANGIFPDGGGGAGAAHRRMVRDAAGAEAEHLVADYQALRWSPAVIVPLLRNWGEVGAAARDVLLMRAANELEDHIAFGMRLCDEGRLTFGVSREDTIEVARLLGQPDLARALGEAFRANDEAEWAADIALPYDISFRLPSKSSLTGSEHLKAAFEAALRKLRRVVGLGPGKPAPQRPE